MSIDFVLLLQSSLQMLAIGQSAYVRKVDWTEAFSVQSSEGVHFLMSCDVFCGSTTVCLEAMSDIAKGCVKYIWKTNLPVP
jgi:hypothetical protein